MNEEVKLCKDCKYFEEINIPEYGEYFQCLQSYRIDVVSGNKLVASCDRIRKDNAMCGLKATWFEHKPIAKSKLDVIINGMQTKLKELFK